jgi:hypothetical protein
VHGEEVVPRVFHDDATPHPERVLTVTADYRGWRIRRI